MAVKPPGREADHSLPSSAEVVNERSYTSVPLCAFTALSGTILPFPLKDLSKSTKICRYESRTAVSDVNARLSERERVQITGVDITDVYLDFVHRH